MKLFKAVDVEQITKIAAKSNEALQAAKPVSAKSINSELQEIEARVVEYFHDSPAILINSKQELHDYVSACIEYGYAGIDTETTGLDRINDHVVGASLYVPGKDECYIPIKHKVPIFDQPYKNQLTYQEVAEEFQRFVDEGTRLIFANADFDIAMIYHDMKVALEGVCYYDVILAWRCIKENEIDNALKTLYAKYVKKGQVDPKKFSDFFPPKLFPYCKPEVAKLYAANDAKITFELFLWQLPYVTKTNPKCQKAHLEKIADLVWNIEMPMIKVCAGLHRVGVYLDYTTSRPLHERYESVKQADDRLLAEMVQELINEKDTPVNRTRPFRTGSDFNPNSPPHVKYLVNTLLGKDVDSTGKDILNEINLPVTKQILKVRGDVKLLTTYIDKLPNATGPDDRIHCTFKSIGAATGRLASEAPNMQNIPSHATDIRHMFRATPEQIETIDLSNQLSNELVEIKLSNSDSIPTSTGITKVRELQEGTIVIMKEDGVHTNYKIEYIESSNGYSVIKLGKGYPL